MLHLCSSGAGSGLASDYTRFGFATRLFPILLSHSAARSHTRAPPRPLTEFLSGPVALAL